MRTKKVREAKTLEQGDVNEIVEDTLETMTKENVELLDEMISIDPRDINRMVEAVEKKDEEVLVTWESEIRKQVMEFVDNMLVVAKECNMGTRYVKPVKAQYEGYAEYDDGKAEGAELRLVFKFVEPIDLSKVNLV